MPARDRVPIEVTSIVRHRPPVRARLLRVLFLPYLVWRQSVQRGGVLQALLALLAISVLAVSIWFLTSAATRQAGAQLLIALLIAGGTYRTLQVTREGQFTDRYSKAIEQLGDSKPEIRLGAIYALERIAHDSFRDHDAAMDVLCAYARRVGRGARPAWRDEDPSAKHAFCQVITRATPPPVGSWDLSGVDLLIRRSK